MSREVLLDFDRYATNYREVLNDSVSASGESGEYFANYKAQYIARLLGTGFEGRILDYGCGIGMVTAELTKLLPRGHIEAFDQSASSIANVSPALRKKARFCSDLSEVGIADVIIIANVLHHVPVPDRKSLIKQLSERLSGAGCLVIFEHNPINPLTRAAVRDCPFDEDAVLLPSSEAISLCTGAGLHFVRRDYIVFFPRLLSWLRPIESVLRWLSIGAQYAVVAQNG